MRPFHRPVFAPVSIKPVRWIYSGYGPALDHDIVISHFAAYHDGADEIQEVPTTTNQGAIGANTRAAFSALPNAPVWSNKKNQKGSLFDAMSLEQIYLFPLLSHGETNVRRVFGKNQRRHGMALPGIFMDVHIFHQRANGGGNCWRAAAGHRGNAAFGDKSQRYLATPESGEFIRYGSSRILFDPLRRGAFPVNRRNSGTFCWRSGCKRSCLTF